jgi:hypothetical protein
VERQLAPRWSQTHRATRTGGYRRNGRGDRWSPGRSDSHAQHRDRPAGPNCQQASVAGVAMGGWAERGSEEKGESGWWLRQNFSPVRSFSVFFVFSYLFLYFQIPI